MSLKDVHPDHVFWVQNGKRLKNLAELERELTNMDDVAFFHHVNHTKNDFYNWVLHSIKDETLARKMQGINDKRTMQKVVNEHIQTLQAQMLKAKAAPTVKIEIKKAKTKPKTKAKIKPKAKYEAKPKVKRKAIAKPKPLLQVPTAPKTLPKKTTAKKTRPKKPKPAPKPKLEPQPTVSRPAQTKKQEKQAQETLKTLHPPLEYLVLAIVLAIAILTLFIFIFA